MTQSNKQSVALLNNQIRLVQASILGSILVNLLLILGSALLASSAVDREPSYNTSEAQLLACLLFVSVFVFLMPVGGLFLRPFARSLTTGRLPSTTRSTSIMRPSRTF